jgi:hypothetical protein
METTTSCCPFCNAVLPKLTAPAAAEKIPCPRCGELIPAVRWEVTTSIAAGDPKKPLPPGREPGPGIRKTAMVILGVMLTMAIVGLGYMLWTVKERRARDPKLILDPVTYRKPLELPGLGYLPKNSDVIVGLQIAEWLSDKKVGQPLLEKPRPAPLDWVVQKVAYVSGLPLEEIDHIVLGASLDKLQIVAVVRTRRPYSLEKIAEHATRWDPPIYRDKALYRLPLTPPAEALVWCIEEKTLVCVIRIDGPNIEHLNGLSLTPGAVEEIVAAPLYAALKERLPRQQYLWAVGRFDRLALPKEALGLLGDKAALIKEVRTFAVGLEPVEGLTLTGHFQTADAKSAAKVTAFLATVNIAGATSQKVEAPPPDVADPWVTWQLRGDVGAMREWMNQGAAKKK